ncbi:MAG: septum formation inhibitor Maf [Verrucomicrobiaceae bacterium]|nr:septum formation inhibitor Maf [Verrucomicrobiaceae bacterium]
MTAEAVLYLASQSPRRRELLTQIDVAHRALKIDIDESRRVDESAEQYVQRLAREKAAAGWQHLHDAALPPLPVLGADTAVVLDDIILGKPTDADDARAILQRLAGRAHEVLTGVAVCGTDGVQVTMSRTRVWFRPLSAAEIDAYWLTGEPRDKAGAYGIQGRAAVFVERIEGSYSGVVGLPLFETAEQLRRYGIGEGYIKK